MESRVEQVDTLTDTIFKELTEYAILELYADDVCNHTGIHNIQVALVNIYSPNRSIEYERSEWSLRNKKTVLQYRFL